MDVFLSSRGLRAYAGGILAGILSAGLFAAAYMQDRSLIVFLGCLLLSYFSSVPLFVAGLGAGVWNCAVAIAAGIAMLCLINAPAFALLYVALYGLPAIGLTALALRQPLPPGRGEKRILTAITLYPCALFLALAAGLARYKGGLLALTMQKMNDTIAPLKGQVDPGLYQNFVNAMHGMVRLSPSLVGCTWMFILVLSLIVAQKVLKQQNWNQRSDFALTDISIPGWLVFAAAATGLGGALAPAPFDYVGTNLCVMLCVPFFFVGLAVVHVWAATTRMKTAILIGFYIILMMLVWLSLLITALGAFDQWFNFRQRLAAGQQGG